MASSSGGTILGLRHRFAADYGFRRGRPPAADCCSIVRAGPCRAALQGQILPLIAGGIIPAKNRLAPCGGAKTSAQGASPGGWADSPSPRGWLFPGGQVGGPTLQRILRSGIDANQLGPLPGRDELADGARGTEAMIWDLPVQGGSRTNCEGRLHHGCNWVGLSAPFFFSRPKTAPVFSTSSACLVPPFRDDLSPGPRGLIAWPRLDYLRTEGHP